MDGTLLDRAASMREFARDQYARLRLGSAGVSREDYVSLLLKHDRNGEVDKLQLYKALRADLPLLNAPEILRSDLRTHYMQYVRGFPHLRDVLSRVKAMGLALAIVTNGDSRRQRQKLARIEVDQFFPHDFVIVSGEVGASKPDSAIFRLALDRVAIADPRAAVFVGNHPVEDIAGASASGLRTIWMEDLYWDVRPHADRTIARLADLPHAVMELDDHG